MLIEWRINRNGLLAYSIYIHIYANCAHYYTHVCFAQPQGKSHSGHKVNSDGIWRSITHTHTHTHNSYVCVYCVGDRNCNGSSDVAEAQDDTSGTRFRPSAVCMYSVMGYNIGSRSEKRRYMYTRVYVEYNVNARSQIGQQSRFIGLLRRGNRVFAARAITYIRIYV